MDYIQDEIDDLLPDNDVGSISEEDMRDSFKLLTQSPYSAVEKAAEALTGFDREMMQAGGKNTGILEYCHEATSGEVHIIASDQFGVYTLDTGRTHFADGTALVDRSFMQFKDSGEDDFSYWRHGELIRQTDARFIQVAADFKGYLYYDESGDLDNTITSTHDLIVNTPLVSFLYNNITKGTVEWLGDERHGQVLTGQGHLLAHMHPSLGFFVVPGSLDIHGITNNGSTWTSIEGGYGGDEDIKMAFSAVTTLPKLYMEGALREWTYTDDDNNLGIFRGGDCCYNDVSGTPSLEGIGNKRITMIIQCGNNKIHPMAILVGQNLHDNRGLARAYAPSDYARIKHNGLPAQEAHPVGSIIVNNESAGQAEVGSELEIWYDHREIDSAARKEGDND